MNTKDETPQEENLIEKFERETGSRWDDENSPALAGLFGAISRIMGESNHSEKDDVVAGFVIQHQLSPQGKREAAANQMIADLLSGAGLSPDDIAALLGE